MHWTAWGPIDITDLGGAVRISPANMKLPEGARKVKDFTVDLPQSGVRSRPVNVSSACDSSLVCLSRESVNCVLLQIVDGWFEIVGDNVPEFDVIGNQVRDKRQQWYDVADGKLVESKRMSSDGIMMDHGVLTLDGVPLISDVGLVKERSALRLDWLIVDSDADWRLCRVDRASMSLRRQCKVPDRSTLQVIYIEREGAVIEQPVVVSNQVIRLVDVSAGKARLI